MLLSARIFMMTDGPAARIAKVLEEALPPPEMRLELSVDPAHLMRRQRVPEFLSRGGGPRFRSRPNRRLAWLGC